MPFMLPVLLAIRPAPGSELYKALLERVEQGETAVFDRGAGEGTPLWVQGALTADQSGTTGQSTGIEVLGNVTGTADDWRFEGFGRVRDTIDWNLTADLYRDVLVSGAALALYGGQPYDVYSAWYPLTIEGTGAKVKMASSMATFAWQLPGFSSFNGGGLGEEYLRSWADGTMRAEDARMFHMLQIMGVCLTGESIPTKRPAAGTP